MNGSQKTYQKASLVCFIAFWVVLIAADSLAHAQGEFSYVRFAAGFLCWLLAIVGAVFAFVSIKKSEHKPSRLLSIALITFNIAGIILWTIFLVGGLHFLRLEHKAREEEAKGRTNANFLAFGEFRSNRYYFITRYTNAAQALARLKDLPVSSLRSKELLEKRGTNFANFIAAGTQLREFYINAPEKFRQEVENSGQSPQIISTALFNFRRRDLQLWDESYTVLEKTLQMTSNTLILNNLLASNFDQWYVSNAALVFTDKNLQVEYYETAAKVKQFKRELDSASEHMNELQHKHALKTSADVSKQ